MHTSAKLRTIASDVRMLAKLEAQISFSFFQMIQDSYLERVIFFEWTRYDVLPEQGYLRLTF